MMRLPDWSACDMPGQWPLEGVSSVLEPYQSSDHLAALFEAVAGPGNEDIWAYMPIGPFQDALSLERTLAYTNEKLGWQTLIIRSKSSSTILGMASFMRLRPEHGSAEIGCVAFGKALQRTKEATEAVYLMGRHLFDELGYRRFEWKCDAQNEASKRAALRFGFEYEGLFRQDMVVKGRSRDTAWYAMIDKDWPGRRTAFEAWLSAENFDASGQQRQKLESFRR